MIRENQNLLNRLNVLSDAALIYLMLPLAFWLRFSVLPDGVVTVPLRSYLLLGAVFTLVQLFTYAAFGLYQTSRKTRIRDEVYTLLRASFLDMLLLLGWLFVGHGVHYSRWTLALYYILSLGALAVKRIVVRKTLRRIRSESGPLTLMIPIPPSP